MDDRDQILNSARALYDLGKGDHAENKTRRQIADQHYARLKQLVGSVSQSDLESRWTLPDPIPEDDGSHSWQSLKEIETANAESGHHWFSPATIKFFETRTYDMILHGRYFVSSELPPHGRRIYKVRYADHVGRIRTVADPQLDLGGFATFTAARRWLHQQVESGNLISYGADEINNMDDER